MQCTSRPSFMRRGAGRSGLADFPTVTAAVVAAMLRTAGMRLATLAFAAALRCTEERDVAEVAVVAASRIGLAAIGPSRTLGRTIGVERRTPRALAACIGVMRLVRTRVGVMGLRCAVAAARMRTAIVVAAARGYPSDGRRHDSRCCATDARDAADDHGFRRCRTGDDRRDGRCRVRARARCHGLTQHRRRVSRRCGGRSTGSTDGSAARCRAAGRARRWHTATSRCLRHRRAPCGRCGGHRLPARSAARS